MKPPAWSDAPIQVIPRPVCPSCGTDAKPILVRSSVAADSATWQRCVCTRCSSRWNRVLLPNSGKLPDSSSATQGDE